MLHYFLSSVLLGGANNKKSPTECMQAFKYQEIAPFIVDSSLLSPNIKYVFFYISPFLYSSVTNTDQLPIHGLAPGCVLACVPLHILVPHLSVKQLKELVQFHSIVLTCNMNMNLTKAVLSSAICLHKHCPDSCEDVMSLFTAIPVSSLPRIREILKGPANKCRDYHSKPQSDRHVIKNVIDRQGITYQTKYNAERRNKYSGLHPASVWEYCLPLYSFPPNPATPIMIRESIRRFCNDASVNQLEESGCCVCGLLVPVRDLQDRKGFEGYFRRLLCTSTPSRKIRLNKLDPISTLDGPIVLPSTECLSPVPKKSFGRKCTKSFTGKWFMVRRGSN
jgi:hypothetical protein